MELIAYQDKTYTIRVCVCMCVFAGIGEKLHLANTLAINVSSKLIIYENRGIDVAPTTNKMKCKAQPQKDANIGDAIVVIYNQPHSHPYPHDHHHQAHAHHH